MWPSSLPSGLSAAAHIVALVGALSRELNARPAITIRVAAVGPRRRTIGGAGSLRCSGSQVSLAEGAQKYL